MGPLKTWHALCFLPIMKITGSKRPIMMWLVALVIHQPSHSKWQGFRGICVRRGHPTASSPHCGPPLCRGESRGAASLGGGELGYGGEGKNHIFLCSPLQHWVERGCYWVLQTALFCWFLWAVLFRFHFATVNTSISSEGLGWRKVLIQD